MLDFLINKAKVVMTFVLIPWLFKLKVFAYLHSNRLSPIPTLTTKGTFSCVTLSISFLRISHTTSISSGLQSIISSSCICKIN